LVAKSLLAWLVFLGGKNPNHFHTPSKGGYMFPQTNARENFTQGG